MEIWKPIPCYEGLYEVSNYGNIRSLFRYKKVLKPWDIGTGYLMIYLSKEKTRKAFLVHRLVANAFIPNPEGKPQVNHIDENRANNSADNLEWCTCKENHDHGLHSKRLSIAMRNNPKKSKPVEQCTMQGKVVAVFPSIAEAARSTGFNKADICECCREKRHTCKKYIWRYSDADSSHYG